MHQDKFCPKCGVAFQCKADTIAACQCAAIVLNDNERKFINSIYSDCLCIHCIKELQNTFMNKIPRMLTSWSGGKDSCFAMMQAIANGMQPVVLLNMMNEHGEISRSHAIPKNILQKQAAALNLPIITVAASWAAYEEKYIAALKEITATYKIGIAVFGDIDLQAHKDWEEKVCHIAGIKALLPLWQQNRKELVLQMLQQGIKTYIVSCNEAMGEAFLGRLVDESLLNELTILGIDECGENGEYHTLVVNCPLFKNEIDVTFGKKKHHGQYWFIEMK